jgi:hypothetical protein
MLKKAARLLVCLFVLSTPCAALAALPGNTITYKTVLKTDDFYAAVNTATVEWTKLPEDVTVLPEGGTTVALTVRWAYARPDKLARAYPAVRQGLAWRFSRYAVMYDQGTGFVKLMELETTLYDRQGQVAAQLRADRKEWRLLLPTDPEYEVFEKVIAYLAETAR